MKNLDEYCETLADTVELLNKFEDQFTVPEDFICPQCGEEKFKRRQWSQDHGICVSCVRKNASDKRLPADRICPQCEQYESDKTKWNIKHGVCKACHRKNKREC